MQITNSVSLSNWNLNETSHCCKTMQSGAYVILYTAVKPV